MAKIRKPVDPELALSLLLGQEQQAPVPKQEPTPPPVTPDITEYQKKRSRLIDSIIGQAEATAGSEYAGTPERDEILSQIRKDPSRAAYKIAELPGFHDVAPANKDVLEYRKTGTQLLADLARQYDELLKDPREAKLQAMLKGRDVARLQKNIPFVQKQEQELRGKKAYSADEARKITEAAGGVGVQLRGDKSGPGLEQSLEQKLFGGREPAFSEQRTSERPDIPIPQELMQEPPSEEEAARLISTNYGTPAGPTQEETAEGRASAMIALRDLMERKTADQFGQEEAAKMDAALPQEQEETPYTRYLDMLGRDQEFEPGLLDIVATLGLSLGGASPDTLTGVIDSLRGGPQRREKLGRAKTAAELFAGRQASEQEGAIAQQKLMAEQIGQGQRQQAEIGARRSNLEFEQGAIGERLEKQLQNDLLRTQLQVSSKDQGLSNPDIRALMERGEEPVQEMINQARIELSNIENDFTMKMADPAKYNTLKRNVMSKMSFLEDMRRQHRAQFVARLQGGDEQGLYEPANTDPAYQKIIGDIDAILRMKK